jgi:hypothetical protein
MYLSQMTDDNCDHCQSGIDINGICPCYYFSDCQECGVIETRCTCYLEGQEPVDENIEPF